MYRFPFFDLLPQVQQQDGSPGTRLCAAGLRTNDLRQAILVEFEGKDLSSLSVVALRHSLEGRLGLGRDGLNAWRREISDLAREMAEQFALV